MTELNCIHRKTGLCPRCQREFDLDAQAWLEYGDHPEGLRRWAELREELEGMAAEEPCEPLDDFDLPF